MLDSKPYSVEVLNKVQVSIKSGMPTPPNCRTASNLQRAGFLLSHHCKLGDKTMKRANLRILTTSTTTLMFAFALGVPTLAVAQDEQPSTGALEEIIVTARKREESLQDVGLSLSALSKTDLDRRFDIDLQTLQNASPNLVIDDIQQGPGSPAAISIRWYWHNRRREKLRPDGGCGRRWRIYRGQLRRDAQGHRSRKR